MLNGRSSRHELDIDLSEVHLGVFHDCRFNPHEIAHECCSVDQINNFIAARDSLPTHLKPFLTPYTVDQYLALEARVFLTKEHHGGFAIVGDQLTSLFSLPGANLGNMLVVLAKLHGAECLSCYDTNNKLTSMYARHGFQETLRVPWNETLAPRGWDYNTWGTPDFVEMRL